MNFLFTFLLYLPTILLGYQHKNIIILFKTTVTKEKKMNYLRTHLNNLLIGFLQDDFDTFKQKFNSEQLEKLADPKRNFIFEINTIYFEFIINHLKSLFYFSKLIFANMKFRDDPMHSCIRPVFLSKLKILFSTVNAPKLKIYYCYCQEHKEFLYNHIQYVINIFVDRLSFNNLLIEYVNNLLLFNSHLKLFFKDKQCTKEIETLLTNKNTELYAIECISPEETLDFKIFNKQINDISLANVGQITVHLFLNHYIFLNDIIHNVNNESLLKYCKPDPNFVLQRYTDIQDTIQCIIRQNAEIKKICDFKKSFTDKNVKIRFLLYEFSYQKYREFLKSEFKNILNFNHEKNKHYY